MSEDKTMQLRHNCPGGHHRLVAKIVNHQLELVCASCGRRYYWDRAFLRMLLNLLDSNLPATIFFE